MGQSLDSCCCQAWKEPLPGPDQDSEPGFGLAPDLMEVVGDAYGVHDLYANGDGGGEEDDDDEEDDGDSVPHPS